MLRASSHRAAAPSGRAHARHPPATRRAAPSAAARRPRVYATPATRTRLSEHADAPRGIVGKIKTVWHIFFPPEVRHAALRPACREGKGVTRGCSIARCPLLLVPSSRTTASQLHRPPAAGRGSLSPRTIRRFVQEMRAPRQARAEGPQKAPHKT